MKTERKICCENRKAYHDYTIVDKMEVGIVLRGSEVKSIVSRKVSLNGSFCQILNGELFWVGNGIEKVRYGGFGDVSGGGNIKLLCHRKELNKIKEETERKGMTCIPLSLYLGTGKIKLEIGLGKGKKKADKRMSLKEKDLRRDGEW